MNILILMTSYKWLLALREELVDGLLSSGYGISILGPFDGNEKFFVEKGCDCHHLEVQRRGTSILADMKVFNTYHRLMKQIRPDVVMTFSIKANIYGALAARVLRIPRVVSISGLGSGLHGGGALARLLLFMYRISLKGASCIFFQNTHNLQFMRGHNLFPPRQHVRLISGSGVNLSKFQPVAYPADDLETRFLFIGRLMKEKGLDELLSAFQTLSRTHEGVRLDLLGLAEEDYTDKLRQAGGGGKAAYHGEQHDVRPYIARSHCVVLPSYHEGMANVLLEAAASGRPVIATRIPGCRETFDEGISGLGCEPRSAGDLARAMEEFVRLPHTKKQQMGLAGRAKMEREFDRRKVIDAYLEEIDKLRKERQTS